MTRTVCFHGAESTGKSVLAAQLSAELGCPWVPEYGRTYCEEHGTDLTMADLRAIAEGQAAAVARVLEGGPPLAILDTDQLMTAAWAEMLFGTAPSALLAYPKAHLYVLFDADVPWVDDGTRLFGKAEERERFAALAQQMLDRSGVRYVTIRGTWNERERAVRALVEEMRLAA